MDSFFQQVCEKFIKEKVEVYACVVDIETYDMLYMTQSLHQRLEQKNRGASTKCYELLHGFNTPCSFCPLEKVLEEKEYTWGYYSENPRRYFGVTDYLFEYNDKKYIVHTSKDITKEMETIDKLEGDVKNLDTMLDCANVLISQHEPNTSIKKLLKILTDFYEAEFSYLFERDYSTDLSNCTYHYTSPTCSLEDHDFDFSFDLANCQPWVEFMKPKDYAFIHAYDEEAKLFPIKNSEISIRENCNYLFTPLNLNGITVGTICIANLHKNINNFKPVTEITAFVINSLALKYAAHKLKMENEKNQLLLNCAQTLMVNRKFEEAIHRMLEVICDYFEARFSIILEADEQKDIVIPKYCYERNEITKVANSGKVAFTVLDLWSQSLGEDGFLYIKDLKKDLEENIHDTKKEMQTYSALASKDIHSFALSSLNGRTKQLGFLWLENPKQNIKDLPILNTLSMFIVRHMSKNELLKKYEHLSFIDKLTSLQNRNAYILYIDALKNIKNTPIGIIYCDINGLKFVNDKLGHAFGDLFIKYTADFLMAHVKENVFRTGGDEFVCILENMRKKDFDAHVKVIQQELSSKQEKFISIGFSWAEDTSHIDELISHADNNMYKEKQKYYKECKKDIRNEKEKINNFKVFLS